MVHEGHFQIGPARGLEGRGGETLNIGTCDMMLLALLVDEAVEKVTLALDLFTVAATVDLGAENNSKVTWKHSNEK